MFDNLAIFKISSAMASHASRRHAIVAENMANSDTPGFKARKIAKFSDVVDGFEIKQNMRSTRQTHMFAAPSNAPHAKIETVRGDAAPNGNTVSIEREMFEAVSAKREHDRAMTIYKSALKIIQTTLARS